MPKLMTHIVAGYPTLEKSEEIAIMMAKSGVHFIEIQIPFSDPVADGPTIMRANERALENKVCVGDCFRLMSRLSKKISTPLLFMSYFNILFQYGVENFCKKTAESGGYGLIIPDIPFDEEKYEHYIQSCKKYGLKPILVVSPLTTEKRLKLINKYAEGFIYCVSRFGITGSKNNLNPDLSSYIKKVRKFTNLPLAVGFGISTREHVKKLDQIADIVVIGSKIINLIDEGEDLSNFLFKSFFN